MHDMIVRRLATLLAWREDATLRSLPVTAATLDAFAEEMDEGLVPCLSLSWPDGYMALARTAMSGIDGGQPSSPEGVARIRGEWSGQNAIQS